MARTVLMASWVLEQGGLSRTKRQQGVQQGVCKMPQMPSFMFLVLSPLPREDFLLGLSQAGPCSTRM